MRYIKCEQQESSIRNRYVTLMSKSNAKRLLPGERIFKTGLELTSYCKTQIQVLGYITVKVRSGKILRKLNLYITTENREPLLGREWILQMKENPRIRHFLGELQSIHAIQAADKLQLQSLLRKYKDITNLSIVKIINIQARLKLKEKVNPVFCKPRGVLFRLCTQVEKELEKLTKEGIVPVIKKTVQYAYAAITVFQ